MADEGPKIETKSVQAFRGLEARTITKWEQEGWRLVTQAPGKLRTELTFERERPPLPKKALIGLAAALAVLAVIITIGVISERNDPTAAAPATTAAAPATSAAAPAATSDVPADPSTPAASESAEPETLTVGNNRDLAALVKETDYCDDSMGKFADEYEGRTLRFDGTITAFAPHNTAKTRYDILLSYGKVDSTVGPAFQYANVNTTSDLGWTGSNVPDSVGVGTELRLTATVDNYDADTCLFHLDPVATASR